MASQHLCVVRGSLFKYDDKSGKYDELGEVGCTIVGTVELGEQSTYKLGCYNDQNEYLCTAAIGVSNEIGANVALQGNYVSFRDEEGTTWSVQLDSEEEAIALCGSVAVAMYGAAGQPQQNILVCDVAKGTPGKTALAGSLAKVRFSVWVVQGDGKTGIPTLGSQLDSTEQRLLTVTVPPNHLSVTPLMKGFEGMLVGMHEQGCRFIIIPKAAQRGAGPRVHMCFFVEVVRIKVNEDGSGGEAITTHGNGLLAITSAAHVPGGSAAYPLQNSQQLATVPSHGAKPQSGVSAGFDRDQFILVDRLRDQVFTLTEQLREARQQLQSFGAEVRSYEQDRKPKSLLNAQIEYSVHKLLTDVDEQKDRLGQRDETLARMEEKNTQLQRTLDKCQQTSNLLQEERKSRVTAQDEEKLELDRQIMQTQTHFNRLSTEVEDTVRNVNAVKRLLDQMGSDTKKEKNELQVALVSFQTNESKLATVKESLREEMERCTLLESKVTILGTELQTLHDDIESKNRVIEECQRKTESDVLHYEQLLEAERQKASDELRGLRRELLEELGARDRRYQEECQRAAQEAYERGHEQGVEDGTAEAMLAADMKAHELTLTVQRSNAEAKAMEARARVAKEEKAVDERRLGAEREAAEDKLAEEQRGIELLEREIESLTQKRNLTTERTYAALERALEAAKGKPVSQRMLLRIIAAVQAGESEVDFTLQAREDLEERRREAQERSEVEAWVRAAVYNQPTKIPPLRPPSAAVDADLPVASDKEDGEHFFKIDDILRIREAQKPSIPLPPLSTFTAPATVATPPQPQPQLSPAPAQPSQPQASNSSPSHHPTQPFFVARNPFQQSPSSPRQHGLSQTGQPAASPPQATGASPPQPPPTTTAPATAPAPVPHTEAARPRVTFPPPHVRPLPSAGPPPSLLDE